MNHLTKKITHIVAFAVAFFIAIANLNAQSTPKVGITQQIGCGTGANADKAEVTVSVDESLTGYQYNFGSGWVTSNKAWLTAGDYTIQVSRNSVSYSLPIRVPANDTPTFTPSVVYNGDNTTANVTLANDQPTYRYVYTYGGNTKSNPYFTNLTARTHNISVTYTAPSTTKSIVFYDDFGKNNRLLMLNQ